MVILFTINFVLSVNLCVKHNTVYHDNGFADDLMICAKNEEKLQVVRESTNKILIKTSKTKTMFIEKEDKGQT